jgi:transcriptional regulator of acetoin/glycerol metabolism
VGGERLDALIGVLAVGNGGADHDPERARTLAAMRSAASMADAAAGLGITRSTLYRRLARYGLHPRRVVHAD